VVCPCIFETHAGPVTEEDEVTSQFHDTISDDMSMSDKQVRLCPTFVKFTSLGSLVQSIGLDIVRHALRLVSENILSPKRW
jgi:hypothetical protein